MATEYKLSYTAAEINNKLGQIDSLSEEIADKVDKTNITLEQHTDGLIYVFVDGKPVGNGVELGNIIAGDVIGTLEENNDILLSGDIADGTYTLKWKNKDGTYTELCPLEVGAIVTYAITQNLTNVTSNNSTAEVREGESFTAKITANDGYIISDIVVTMGGVNITSTAVSGETVAIASVTGDVVITASAVIAPVNILDGTTLHINQRYSQSSSGYITANGYVSSDWLDVQTGDVIRINRPMSVHEGGQSTLMYKDINGTLQFSGQKTLNTTPVETENNGAVTKFTVGTVYNTFGTPSSGTKVLPNIAKLYIGLLISSVAITEADVADLIITKNQEIM